MSVNKLSMNDGQLEVVQVTSVHQPFDTRIFHKIANSVQSFGYRVAVIVATDEPTAGATPKIIRVRRSRHRIVRSTLSAYRCIATALRSKAQIVHMHDPELLFWAPLLRLLGRKVIYDMHENTPSAILGKEWIPRPIRGVVSNLWRVLERVLLFGCSVVFAEASYASEYPWIRNGTVVQNFPKLQSFHAKPRGKRERVKLVYIGGVSPLRGSKVLLELTKRLQQEGLPVSLDLIGPILEDHKRELESLIQEGGIDDVSILGYKDPVTAWRIAAEADIGLAILQRHPNYVRSYPTKMFEYMAMALPVVVSDFPLYRKVIEDTGAGISAPPDNMEQIVRRVRPLVVSSELRREMGAKGRVAAEDRYSWETEAKKLERLYLDLAAECAA